MSVERWVDYSKWQGRVGADKLRLMQAHGIKGVCVGAWHGLDANPYCEPNLRDARQLGLKTATYAVINSRPGSATINAARDACGEEWSHLSFVSPDVEISGVTETILAAAVESVRAMGQRPLIYTGNWFWAIWTRELGHAPDFRDVPCWLAVYNGAPDLNVRPMAGLGPLVAHQYTGSTAAYGTTVDFNVFDAAWVEAATPGKPSPEPISSPPPVEEEIMGKIADQFAALGRQVETEIEQAKKLPAAIPGPQGPAGPAGPAGPPGPAAGTTAGRTYTVVSGDNLTKIAAKFGVGVGALYERNKAVIGSDPNLIQPGMVLVIP